ncbi:MBL fold metallo-hydrolase [Halobellus clavatus]|uniref:Glyoxylase, beta-lactamase superfamily II n=1 Tax=Halobellus clavatus TaxID=660517 RepID=A0A1H3H192_9EURY|nr:MBL fold metallo-hydrolase [Halobellus clavatus]SDY08688.1 Glyoxylase, beta-lactamase superfamily II [Halobellus clavatus]
MTTALPDITEIAPDVYDITVKEAPDARWRVFLFDGETPTLVDAGFEDTVDVVASAAEELGITPARIVITHGDGDHVGGLAGLVDRFDLESWVPEGVEVDIEPDHRFGDGDRVGPFTAVSVPGHAQGHHSLVDGDRGIAVIGDALFGSDARGLPSGYYVLPTAHYSADLGRADEELSNLLEYDFDVGLVYHGSSVTENASEKIAAFVDFAGKR